MPQTPAPKPRRSKQRPRASFPTHPIAVKKKPKQALVIPAADEGTAMAGPGGGKHEKEGGDDSSEKFASENLREEIRKRGPSTST